MWDDESVALGLQATEKQISYSSMYLIVIKYA